MRIETLYSCLVCGDGFDTRQGLASHMRTHKDVEFTELHVRIPKDVADAFKKVYTKHKTTSCHLLYTLIKATVKGDETGMIDLSAKNPLIVNMVSFFGGRPRGRRKWDLKPLLVDPLSRAVSCENLRHKEWNPGRLGWCRSRKRWVTPLICEGCQTSR